MADTVFALVQPDTKAVDLLDGTYALLVEELVVPGGGTDTTFANTLPPVKAIDYGDLTCVMAVEPV